MKALVVVAALAGIARADDLATGLAAQARAAAAEGSCDVAWLYAYQLRSLDDAAFRALIADGPIARCAAHDAVRGPATAAAPDPEDRRGLAIGVAFAFEHAYGPNAAPQFGAFGHTQASTQLVPRPFVGYRTPTYAIGATGVFARARLDALTGSGTVGLHVTHFAIGPSATVRVWHRPRFDAIVAGELLVGHDRDDATSFGTSPTTSTRVEALAAGGVRYRVAPELAITWLGGVRVVDAGDTTTALATSIGLETTLATAAMPTTPTANDAAARARGVLIEARYAPSADVVDEGIADSTLAVGYQERRVAIAGVVGYSALDTTAAAATRLRVLTLGVTVRGTLARAGAVDLVAETGALVGWMREEDNGSSVFHSKPLRFEGGAGLRYWLAPELALGASVLARYTAYHTTDALAQLSIGGEVALAIVL